MTDWSTACCTLDDLVVAEAGLKLCSRNLATKHNILLLPWGKWFPGVSVISAKCEDGEISRNLQIDILGNKCFYAYLAIVMLLLLELCDKIRRGYGVLVVLTHRI